MFKESAYTYALSMAAITHSVARGCAQNLIRNCSCSEDGSCPDNVEYGLGIAETLLNKRYTSQGSSLKQELAQHNFRAAKLVSLVLCFSHSMLARIVRELVGMEGGNQE